MKMTQQEGSWCQHAELRWRLREFGGMLIKAFPAAENVIVTAAFFRCAAGRDPAARGNRPMRPGLTAGGIVQPASNDVKATEIEFIPLLGMPLQDGSRIAALILIIADNRTGKDAFKIDFCNFCAMILCIRKRGSVQGTAFCDHSFISRGHAREKDFTPFTIHHLLTLQA